MAIADLPLLERAELIIDEMTMPPQARQVIADLAAEVGRLHTWDGLMDVLDEHWPETVFPTVADHEHRDAGPRIVSMLRTVHLLRSELNYYRSITRSKEL